MERSIEAAQSTERAIEQLEIVEGIEVYVAAGEYCVSGALE